MEWKRRGIDIPSMSFGLRMSMIDFGAGLSSVLASGWFGWTEPGIGIVEEEDEGIGRASRPLMEMLGAARSNILVMNCAGKKSTQLKGLMRVLKIPPTALSLPLPLPAREKEGQMKRMNN